MCGSMPHRYPDYNLAIRQVKPQCLTSLAEQPDRRRVLTYNNTIGKQGSDFRDKCYLGLSTGDMQDAANLFPWWGVEDVLQK